MAQIETHINMPDAGSAFPMKALQNGQLNSFMKANKRRFFSYKIKPFLGKPLNVHFAVSNSDVVNFYKDEENLSLSNYDLSLRTGGAKSQFFISADIEFLGRQWALLNRALDLEPAINRYQGDTPSFPFLAPDDPIALCAQAAVNQAVQNILARENAKSSIFSLLKFWRKERRKGEIDVIKDYGNVVTYLIVRDFIGLSVSGQNLFKQSSKLRLMMGPMFFNLFINPGARRPIISFLSNFISKIYKRRILKCYGEAPAETLLGRLRTLEPNSDPVQLDQHRKYVANIVMELAGSFHFLTGSGFAGIVQAIDEKETYPENQPGISNADLVQLVENVAHDPREKLDEYLRHYSPTEFIFRAVQKDFELKSDTPWTDGTTKFSQGDMMCLLTGLASKDGDTFENPDSVMPVENAKCLRHKYLHFGSPDVEPAKRRSKFPSENTPHHPCFGQYWARTILLEMLTGLLRLDNLHTVKRGQFKMNPFSGGIYKMQFNSD